MPAELVGELLRGAHQDRGPAGPVADPPIRLRGPPVVHLGGFAAHPRLDLVRPPAPVLVPGEQAVDQEPPARVVDELRGVIVGLAAGPGVVGAYLRAVGHGEQLTAGVELVDHRPQGEPVRFGGGLLGVDLRRGVVPGPLDGRRQVGDRLLRLGQAEVGQDQVERVLGAHQDIGRFQVAVGDAGSEPVEVGQRPRDLLQDPPQCRGIEPAAPPGRPLAQRARGAVLLDLPGPVRLVVEVDEAHHVRRIGLAQHEHGHRVRGDPGLVVLEDHLLAAAAVPQQGDIGLAAGGPVAQVLVVGRHRRREVQAPGPGRGGGGAVARRRLAAGG